MKPIRRYQQQLYVIQCHCMYRETDSQPLIALRPTDSVFSRPYYW